MMRSKNLEYNLDHSLSFDQEINALLLEIYPMMPSTSSFPFTIIRISATERIGLAAVSSSQILVLKRTDFHHSDLMDYTIHSKEYSYIPSDSQQAFLDMYKLKHQDEAFFTMWRDQITGLGIGILMQLARQRGLNITMVETDLRQLNSRFSFHSKNLQAYQLFNVNFI